MANRSALGGGVGFVLRILVPAAVLFIVMNFLYAPRCGRFACGYEPAWLPKAQADTGGNGCPDSLDGASTDAEWAADRMATIAEERLTVLLAYDGDGTEHRFTSGEDADAERVTKKLHDLGVAADRSGRYPAASHTEPKVAYWMRESGAERVVAVINNSRGVCEGGAQTCDAVVKALLPRGYLLEVWAPGNTLPTQLSGGS